MFACLLIENRHINLWVGIILTIYQQLCLKGNKEYIKN